MNFLLQLLIVIPLLGSLIILFIPNTKEYLIRYIGLLLSLYTLAIALLIWVSFSKSILGFQLITKFVLIPFSNLWCFLGIDGISLHLIILTTILIPVCILLSWNTIKKNIKEYIILLLLLESLLIIIFSVLDLFVFYLFFESVLIPMFIIIGIWGSRKRKIHAAYQFFLYTLLGSIFMLFAILLIYSSLGSTDLQTLLENNFTLNRQILLWALCFISFAIKIPMLPFHIWLPEAHVEAPTAGSIILAGILLKLGGYGMLRYLILLYPDATLYFIPLVYTLSVLGILYTSITTLRQIDLKKIIAYSSVSHMNFVTIGLVTLNSQGLLGGIILMLSHGFVSSALFLAIGLLYDRYKTRLVEYYGGLNYVMPIFSVIFLILIMSNLSLPGTSSFVGEFLVLISIIQNNIIIAAFVTFSIILGAAYSIWLYNKVAFTAISSYFIQNYSDLNKREFFLFVPFLALILILGICPEYIVDILYSNIEYIL